MTKNNSQKNDEIVNSVELVWESKTTEVERTVLPFQVVEVINEPEDKQSKLNLETITSNQPTLQSLT